MIPIYSTDESYLYEIIEDYRDAASSEEKNEIFRAFCSAVWDCGNERKVFTKEIRFHVPARLHDDELAKIFRTWSSVEYTGYKRLTKDTGYASLIRQKINNIYANLFDPSVVLAREYLSLLKTPKSLYYRFLHGEQLDARETAEAINDAIADALLVKEKYQKQKMKLSWSRYQILVDGYLKRIIDNCISIDEHETYGMLTVSAEHWNEDNYYIRYFCRSLDGYFKMYQKSYFGVRQHQKYKRCKKCGSLFEVRHHNQTLCKACSSYQPVGSKTLLCIDCGRCFQVVSRDNRTRRCPDCKKAYIKKRNRIRAQKYRDIARSNL